MRKVNKIHINGFRRLRDIHIEMKPMMVLIGPNGVGKTSFLDAMTLLSTSANGMMNMVLNRFGGVSNLATHGFERKISLGTKIEYPDQIPLKYDLEIEARGSGYAIPLETLTQEGEKSNQEPLKYIESISGNIRYFDPKEKRIVTPNWEHNHSESSLSQVPKMFSQLEEFRRTLGFILHYHTLDVGQHSPVKLPQQMKPALFPGINGEDLVSFLYNLRESFHNRYESIEDTLRAAYPGFKRLNFPPVAAGMISLTWEDEQFKDPFYAHQLSEGTLRFLWLISLLQSPQLPTITMIDEPEVSLHPELLSLLADCMREASQNTQLIVATHSDRLIHFLEPHEVVVMNCDEEGLAKVQWADQLDLEKWLKDYSLDEVWRMGQLGGRP